MPRHRVSSRLRVSRIQGHPGAADSLDGEQVDHQVGSAFHGQADAYLRADSRRGELGGPSLDTPGQGAAGERRRSLTADHESDTIRFTRELFGDAPRHVRRRSGRGVRSAPLMDQRVTLGAGERFRFGAAQQSSEHGVEAMQEAPGRGAREAAAVEFEGEHEVLVFFPR